MDFNKNMGRIIELLDSVQPQYIINFAAQSEVAPSWQHPEHWFQTNAVAITQLINAIKDKKYLKRYVHISSPEVYGTCEGVVREDTPMNPSTPYAASKAAGDFSIFTFCDIVLNTKFSPISHFSPICHFPQFPKFTWNFENYGNVED